MHASSLENMQKCFDRFLSTADLTNKSGVTVIDIGGANVNGSYADIFSDPLFNYHAVDIAPGEGVDIILDDPYKLPLPDHSIDVVVSGQAFEHCEFFWQLFQEMARVLSKNGFIFLIVPSSGPVHRYPVDCYRFNPDSMAALAKYAGIPLLAHWKDERGPWRDLTGVFSYSQSTLVAPELRTPIKPNRFVSASSIGPGFPPHELPEVERRVGQEHYLRTLDTIHRRVQPRGYLEVGVRFGKSFSLAQCPAIGIDPAPALQAALSARQVIFSETSDFFFDEDADDALGDFYLDLALIDGMHLFEFALRDFINIERRALPTSLILIDDIYPNHPLQADRKRQSQVWAGDIWKLHDCLKRHRPDLILLPLNTSPTGLLVVAGLDPTNSVLTDRYNPLVSHYKDLSFSEGPQEAVLSRRGTLGPHDPILEALAVHLRAERQRDLSQRPALTKRILQAFRL